MQAGDDVEDLLYFDLDSLPPVAFEAHRKLIANLKERLRDSE
jgi:hypothetical protein